MTNETEIEEEPGDSFWQFSVFSFRQAVFWLKTEPVKTSPH